MIKTDIEGNTLTTYSDEGHPIKMVDTGFIVRGKAREPLNQKHHKWEEVLDD